MAGVPLLFPECPGVCVRFQKDGLRRSDDLLKARHGGRRHRGGTPVKKRGRAWTGATPCWSTRPCCWSWPLSASWPSGRSRHCPDNCAAPCIGSWTPTALLPTPRRHRTAGPQIPIVTGPQPVATPHRTVTGDWIRRPPPKRSCGVRVRCPHRPHRPAWTARWPSWGCWTPRYWRPPSCGYRAMSCTNSSSTPPSPRPRWPGPRCGHCGSTPERRPCEGCHGRARSAFWRRSWTHPTATGCSSS